MVFFNPLDGLQGLELIKSALRGIREFVRKVIRGVLNFFQEVVQWFKNLKLNPNSDIPILANPQKLKELLGNAPVKEGGIFEAVYNEELDMITHHRIVEADSLDEKTRQILGDEPLVVLS